MTDRSQFNAEDFLVDNTFQHYCASTDKLCVAYWEKYCADHPEQEKTILEAKGLYAILSGNKKSLNLQIQILKESVRENETPIIPMRRNYIWLKIAVAILLFSGFAILFYNYKPQNESINHINAMIFSTKSGERKKITLPDGSIVLLNALSKLSVKENFNKKTREVKLLGEAYFDVVHNKKKPFKVITEDFDINVLGTAFNVKSYPGEKTSETTLIRGLITLDAKNGDKGSITLKPSQKVTFYKEIDNKQHSKVLKPLSAPPEISIEHYIVTKDSTIVETAWTKNRIEIYDQDFEEIKSILEKWYNVEITINNIELKKYRFTARFTHENIYQVLNTLQKVESFNYEVKGNQILISK